MKHFLDFTGALLYAFVMPVITPLLLVVYTVLYLLLAMNYIKKWKLRMPVAFTRFKNPLWQLSLKRYLLFYKS